MIESLFQDNALWKTFEDANEDAELRVAAYLAIMRCPEDRTLSKMAESLKVGAIYRLFEGYIYIF